MHYFKMYLATFNNFQQIWKVTQTMKSKLVTLNDIIFSGTVWVSFQRLEDICQSHILFVQGGLFFRKAIITFNRIKIVSIMPHDK